MRLQNIPDNSQSSVCFPATKIEGLHPGAAQQDARKPVQYFLRYAGCDPTDELQLARVGHVLAAQLEQVGGTLRIPGAQGMLNRFQRRLMAPEPAARR